MQQTTNNEPQTHGHPRPDFEALRKQGEDKEVAFEKQQPAHHELGTANLSHHDATELLDKLEREGRNRQRMEDLSHTPLSTEGTHADLQRMEAAMKQPVTMDDEAQKQARLNEIIGGKSVNPVEQVQRAIDHPLDPFDAINLLAGNVEGEPN